MVTRNPARSSALTPNEPSGVSPYSLAETWALTAQLSPRPFVRVAARDASGDILNQYDRTWPTAEAAPTTTWAMLLADDDLRFRYLCFDFDSAAGNAPRDASRMSYWLDELNIPHLVCISGPTGGRHVWVRLGSPAEASAVHDLAYYVRSILASLDVHPLTNPASGCVRPPYAPHRAGGFSQPLGDLGSITEHEADEDALAHLTALFVDLGATLPTPATALPHGAVVDADGNPKIRGPKRPLSPAMSELLHSSPGPDASHTLARVLIAAADARWAFTDVTALTDSAPALEHARTRRVGTTRTPRTSKDTAKVLAGLWKYAVRFVAAHPRARTGDDSDYRERMDAVHTAVTTAQQRADALPGLWATRNGRVGGTHSQRVVLDALCLYMLQSSQHVVEADIRRLSADTGYGRTTVHTALRALTEEGAAGPAWVQRVGTAEGVNGQRYRLHPRFSPEDQVTNRTQARMRAVAGGTPKTLSLIRELSTRLALLAHDVFCAPRSLGRTSGLLFTHLSPDSPTTAHQLALSTGIDPALLRRRLYALTRDGLAVRVGEGWRRGGAESRDFIARRRDVSGYLAARRAAYEVERKVWAWWLAEVTWMQERDKPRRGQQAPRAWSSARTPEYAAYPRGPSRRRDHAKAAELVKAGYLERGFALEVA